jgi:hypothetical protein
LGEVRSDEQAQPAEQHRTGTPERRLEAGRVDSSCFLALLCRFPGVWAQLFPMLFLLRFPTACRQLVALKLDRVEKWFKTRPVNFQRA